MYAQEFASHRFVAGRAPPQPYAAIDTENSALEMPSSKPPVWAVRRPPPGSSIAARARVWEAKFKSLRESPSGQAGGVEDYEDPEFMQALRMAKKAAELLHSGNPNLIPKNFDKDDGKWSVPDFGIDFERSQSLPVHSSPPRILRGMPPPPPRLSSGSVATPTGTSAVPTGSARSPMTPPTASGDSTSGDSSADSSGDASGDAPSEGDRSARHSSQEWLARQCDFIEVRTLTLTPSRPHVLTSSPSPSPSPFALTLTPSHPHILIRPRPHPPYPHTPTTPPHPHTRVAEPAVGTARFPRGECLLTLDTRALSTPASSGHRRLG